MAPSESPQAAPPSGEDTAKDVRDNKDLAALGYAWVLSVPVLIVKRHSPFVTFHAKQGVVLFLLSVVFWFVPVVRSLLEMFVFLGVLYGFLNAAQGRWTEVPFAGALARGKIDLRSSWKELVAATVRTKQAAVTAWTKHDAVHRRNTGTPAAPESSGSSWQSDGPSLSSPR